MLIFTALIKLEVIMKKTPIIKVEFCLIKKNEFDFDRESVSRMLGIIPTSSCPPKISKGKVCVDNSEETEKHLKGMTIIKSTQKPYKMIIHANWCVEFSVECYSLETALDKLKKILHKKENLLVNLCREQDLFVDLIFRIYTSPDNIPELSLSEEDISYVNSMGASISFDLQLD